VLYAIYVVRNHITFNTTNPMTSHNPAGYYGLEIPEAIEKEIADLCYLDLVETINDIIYSLTPQGVISPAFEHLCADTDDWFCELELSDRLSLVRWLSEILSTKSTK